jgi:AhpD family alkylhydroperoxidase
MSMDDDMNEYFMTAGKTLKTLGKFNPKAMKGFQAFMENVKADGALSKKIKEIIGIAISVYIQCQFCTAWHVKRAMEAGANREEILEACQIAAMVGGGHSLTSTHYAIKAIDEFTE